MELHVQNTPSPYRAGLCHLAGAHHPHHRHSGQQQHLTLDAANTAPAGLWANATTLYVSDSDASKVFVYNLAGGRRATDMFPLDAANTTPTGLWANATTLWVCGPSIDARLYAYMLADRQPRHG